MSQVSVQSGLCYKRGGYFLLCYSVLAKAESIALEKRHADVYNSAEGAKEESESLLPL